MKIALIGYGKMGKAIEQVAIKRGHDIALRIGTGNLGDMTAQALQGADVAIEFSRPDVAFNNLKACFDAGVPVVCGTTAWIERYQEACDLCKKSNGAMFYAANYSIGVNIFFEINRRLAELMDAQSQYDVRIWESHHVNKLDAPSGTALKLANDMLGALDRKKSWTDGEEPRPDEIHIVSERVGDVPGTHTVTWESPLDEIEIRHTAKNRLGFATGAVLAAEWIKGRKGCFEMKDFLF